MEYENKNIILYKLFSKPRRSINIKFKLSVCVRYELRLLLVQLLFRVVNNL